MEENALFYGGIVLGLLGGLATNMFTNAFFQGFPLDKKLSRWVALMFGALVVFGYLYFIHLMTV